MAKSTKTTKSVKRTPKKKTITKTTVTTTTTVVEEDVRVNAYILLDRSGSMVSQWKEAVGSVNGYVEELKKNDVNGVVTVAVFDSISYDIARESPIGKYENLTEGEYSPRGGTPLFDSFMRLASLAESHKNEKTILIVMTDGHENASNEVTKDSVKRKVSALTKRGWEVIFLGANFDVATEAYGVGLASNKWINSSTHNLSQTMTDMAHRSAAYAGSAKTSYAAGAGFNYTEEDKKKAS